MRQIKEVKKFFTSVCNDAMIINEDCNNGSGNVSPSRVNRVQDDTIVNATQGGNEAEELQCRGDHLITTRDSNEAFVHNEGHTDNHLSHVFKSMTIYYQQQLKLWDGRIIKLERIIYAQPQS